MPQTIHRGIKTLIDEANAEIETLSAADSIKAAAGDDVTRISRMQSTHPLFVLIQARTDRSRAKRPVKPAGVEALDGQVGALDGDVVEGREHGASLRGAPGPAPPRRRDAW